MTILIVEDNDELRRLLKSLLIEIADEIYEATDGSEGVKLYRTTHPDWVLMDIFMNPTDGLTAAMTIRKDDPAAKIVFVSNHTDKRTKNAAEKAGGTAFFGKDDLLSLAEFLIRKKSKL